MGVSSSSCDGGETKSTPDSTNLDYTVRLDWRLTKSEVRRRRMKTKEKITTTNIILIKRCSMLKDILMKNQEEKIIKEKK